ncbi:MAG TPA: hypothetical protein VLR47_10120 [Rhodospirillales bacterium]|nr:hypothetical protein [Rhodospirillales bacterium]
MEHSAFKYIALAAALMNRPRGGHRIFTDSDFASPHAAGYRRNVTKMQAIQNAADPRATDYTARTAARFAD